MQNGPATLKRDADQIRRELERLREESPAEYARRSARLLRELEQLKNKRPPYAIT